MKNSRSIFGIIFIVIFSFGCTSNKLSSDFLIAHFWGFQKKDSLFDKYQDVRVDEMLPTLILIPSSKLHLKPSQKADEVVISAFYISSTEITNSQYLFFLNNSDSLPQDLTPYLSSDSKIKKSENGYVVDHDYKNHPIVDVSYMGTELYTNWLTAFNNKRLEAMGWPINPSYRLPSYCEWQLASLNKAPKDTTKLRTYIEPFPLHDYAWYTENSAGKSQAVAQKKPTNLKVYDTKGNVAEWVWDVDVRNFSGHHKENPFYEVADSASVCGGAYADTKSKTSYLANTVVAKSTQSTKIGFRICMSAIYRYSQEF